VIVWDLATDQPVHTLKGHTSFVHGVSFGPNGRRLASGSSDNIVIIWDLGTGQPTRIFKGHTDTVWRVSFSPDGQRLASGSADKTVIIWDVATGQPVRILNGHTDYVNSVKFSPDGQRLASGSGDKTVIVYETNSGHLWWLREADTTESEQQWGSAAWYLQAYMRQETGLQAVEACSGATSPLAFGAAATLIGLRQREERADLAVLQSRFVKAAGLAAKETPDSYMGRETYGAALYRVGRYKEARTELEKAIDLHTKDTKGTGAVSQKLVLALTCHYLGDQQAARGWLTKAVRQMEETQYPSWQDRVRWPELRAEAERTLDWSPPKE